MKTKILLLLLGSLSSNASVDVAEALGERLFNEARFSAYFAKQSRGNVNHQLKKGSPVVDQIPTLLGPAPSPFAGSATSCASCHMVDQGLHIDGVGMRGYNDAATRTQILYRSKDKRSKTLRNTPALIGINSQYIAHSFTHFDGELDGITATVMGNFTGRNMGWLPNEVEKAKKHLVKVIREDNGSGELAQEFGGSYNSVFTGTDLNIPQDFKLDPEYRLDVKNSTDEEIIAKVEEFVFIYVKNIDFSVDDNGLYNGSAYDQFLAKNNISRGPRKDQSIASYTNELIREVRKLEQPKYIEAFQLETHNRVSQFGKEELSGLKIFLNLKSDSRSMCVQCHLPPLFSDTLYHNVGIAQDEYDSVHGAGSFMKLKVPSLAKKENEGIKFLSIPERENPLKADLGAWNFFSSKNTKFSNFMRDSFCRGGNCDNERLSSLMIGRLKTPTLRNLGHSAPYLHNGSARNIESVIKQYIKNSQLAKNGQLRNTAPQLRRMNLKDTDVSDLSAFIKSLDEVYE